MGGVAALLPTLPYTRDNFFLATDLARDVVEGDCLGLHATEADRARLTTGSNDIFLGVAGEVYGGSASVTTSQPAGLDAKPWTTRWGRNIATRIETSATVAYGDRLTLSSVTAGAMRKAAGGEPVYGIAKQAKTATATDFLARCDIFPAGPASAGLGVHRFTFTPAAGAANVCDVLVTPVDVYGATVAAPMIYDLYLSDAATGIGLTGTTASGTVTAKAASGVVFSTYTAKKDLRVQTLATGLFTLEITDTAKTGFFVAARRPSGLVSVSAQLVTANYG